MELGEAYQDQGLVFPGPFGRPIDPSVITRNFEKLARKAGFPGVRLHDLRHGHATGLIRAGVHDLVVQKRLGHASAAFTMQVYDHVAAGLQAEAAKAFANYMANPSG
jgi:integrase